jgi:hypothetical protein
MATKSELMASTGLSNDSHRHATTQSATCLLCRLLWPRVLEHRHLSVGSASEGETRVLTVMRQSNNNER